MSDMRNNVPLFLMHSSVVLFTVLATLKLQHWEGIMFGLGVLTVGGYLSWLVSESSVSLTESDKGETSKDKGTCELYAFGRALTVATALWAPTLWVSFNWVMGLGLVIFVFGVLFRLNGIKTLGEFYSHRVRLVGDHKVIDTGPYQFVRHPAYTGMLASHFGFVLFFYSPWAMAAFLFVLVPAVITRIRIEERALFELDGYPEYAATHKRLVPLVW
ncbi:hypothetical protein A9Q99_10975 [Gammaproteobacteria bacterium 45_16_T64]|nr:hypothetical protein A9Q99_10975 [Gammaproteobacteria bacterium 45_16_T64]